MAQPVKGLAGSAAQSILHSRGVGLYYARLPARLKAGYVCQGTRFSTDVGSFARFLDTFRRLKGKKSSWSNLEGVFQ